MVCPLRRWVFNVEAQQLIPEQLDCLKEECAWWSKAMEGCSILGLEASLSLIGAILLEMKDKIPHERQFRR